VGGTGVVKDERVGPNGGVLCAGGIEQERYRADCSVGTCVVEGQRSSADTGIETAGGIQKERPPTKRCISPPPRYGIKPVAPCGCSEIGEAPIRCRTDRPRSWQKREAG